MISVCQALDLMMSVSLREPENVVVPLRNASGYYLAKSAYSRIDMPPFDQSAMDGYAVRTGTQDVYTVIGTTKAGDIPFGQLEAGQAVRIFTGAAVPANADAVVMQEKVEINQDGTIKLQIPLKSNENIRPRGEQIFRDKEALPAGTYLNAGAIGFLASLGVKSVSVYERASVAVVITGSELTSLGEPLELGKIYESNAVMLQAALQRLGYTDIAIHKVDDNLENIQLTFSKLLLDYDCLIVTGGISVGDYDFVKTALENEGVREIFYKVKQRPGKPLFFGRGEAVVLALPGNPAAALTCLYIYGSVLLARLSGATRHPLSRIKCLVQSTYAKKAQRAEFLKAFVDESGVTFLESQSSAMLHSFTLANALAYIPDECEKVNIGDLVDVFLIPD